MEQQQPQAQAAPLIALTDEEFNYLVTYVYNKFGIDLKKKRQLIEGRLYSTLRTKNMNTFSEYIQLLSADKTGNEINAFLNKITTNYSYFARENDHFDFLAKNALPYLEHSRKNDLRIWSAGCSAGQEAYSIAMTIDRYFGARKGAWDTTILATDISTNVLDKARRGEYDQASLNDIPPQWKRLYFKELANGNFQLCERIRNEVVFRIFNLMDTFVYKKRFDIIFCRNVMIYFDTKTTNELVEKFYEATADGGYLFIGHSENIDRANLGYTCVRPSVYQKLNRKG